MVGSAETVAAGRRGRRPLQGGCDAITPAVIPRRAGVKPRPYRGLAERGRVGGGRRKGSSRTPTPTAGGKRAACRGFTGCGSQPREMVKTTARMGGVFIGFLRAAGRTQRWDPLLRFFGTRGFRALRRAARGAAPGPRPLFCKKAGQKTFTGRDFCPPSLRGARVQKRLSLDKTKEMGVEPQGKVKSTASKTARSAAAPPHRRAGGAKPACALAFDGTV